MRVLLLTGSSARYMAPPQLGDEQINAGPDWTDTCDAQGRWRSLATPVGEYSIAPLLAKLPLDQWPDAIVCLVDASRRNQPRNLGSFKGPKVLLLADTHHMSSPLLAMMRYASAEPFDRVVLLYDRHHAPIFTAAGFKNLSWFPGLTFPHGDEVVASAVSKVTRQDRLAFVGQTGRFHPRRTRLIDALRAAKLPLQVSQVAQPEALRAYAGATVGFNCSLNGDLNLRFFEVLAAGGLVLTDALGADSGLDELAAQGCEFATYRAVDELIAVARDLLASPEETRRCGAAGRAWFERTLNAARRRELFRRLAFDGVAPAEFPLPAPERMQLSFTDQRDLLVQTLAYETVQELHRAEESVTVLGPDLSGTFARLLATLPRATVVAAGQPATFLAATGEELLAADLTAGPALWWRDAEAANADEVSGHLARAGYVATNAEAGLYRFEPVLDERVKAADQAIGAGQLAIAAGLVQSVFGQDANHVGALLVTARMAVATTDAGLGREVLTMLRTLVPDHPQLPAIAQALATLEGPTEDPVVQNARAAFAAGRMKEAAQAVHAYLKTHAKDVTGWRLLAEILVALGRPQDALNAMRRVVLLGAIELRDWLFLADCRQALGRPEEALSDLLRAAYRAPDDLTVAARVVEGALGFGLATTVEAFLSKLEAANFEPKRVAQLRARAAQLTKPGPVVDLLITHNEVCRRHGTGVLLERYFEGSGPFVTLRSHTLYEGQTNFTATHLYLDAAPMEPGEEEAHVRELLSNYTVRRILCVPFYEADTRRAVLARRLTGAPLCAYVMDDQTLFAKGIPHGSARLLFEAAQLRLVISPEMRDAYEAKFDLPFDVMPPLLTSREGHHVNRWTPTKDRPARRAALVGNVWSAGQFAQLRAFVRSAGLQLDWFGNAKCAWLPADPKEYERDGIFARGFLPESELAARLVDYPFVVVPSGKLDGTEGNEWLTRLSLPSRMVFLLQTHTPMLVLGHPDTAASQFVSRLGLGVVAPYEAEDFVAKLDQLTQPEARKAFLANAARHSPAFIMPEAGKWIWQSLAAGEALPAPFDPIYRAGSDADRAPLLPAAKTASSNIAAYQQLLRSAMMRKSAADALGLLRLLTGDHTVPYDARLRLLLATFSVAAGHAQPLGVDADLPARRCVLVYQPWFNFDFVEMVRAELRDGGLLAVFSGFRSAGKRPLIDLSRENFRTWTYQGFKLWDICEYRLSTSLRKLPERITGQSDGEFAAIERVFGEAVNLLAEAQDFLRFYRPQRVIFAQGYDLIAAVMRHVALAAGVPVISLENVLHRGKLGWENSTGIAVNSALPAQFYHRWRDAVSAQAAAETVDGYFASVDQHKSAEHLSRTASALPPFDGATLVYLAQVSTDAAVLYGRRGSLPHQVDAIIATAEAAERLGARVVVKLHPKESPHNPNPEPYFRQLTLEWLQADERFAAVRARLGERCIVDAENQLHTFDLIRQAQACVTLNSQAGLEALALGREVVLCGRSFFGSLGFTHEAHSAEEVQAALAAILRHGLRLNREGESQRFLHIFLRHYCVEKSEARLRAFAQGEIPADAPLVAESAA